MTQPAQAGLDTADENGHIFINLTDQVAIDHSGIIRALAHLGAGGEGVGLALVLGDGIMVDHGIHIASGYQETQPGTAVDIDGLRIFPIGLGNDAHAVALAFQDTADNGMTKGGVVYVGIADDVDKVALAPAPVQHILFADGKKAHVLTSGNCLFQYNIFRPKREDKKAEKNC